MKTYKELAEGFGKQALQKTLADKGFGTKSREEELESRKQEMAERHAKADAEMAARDKAWKDKFGAKLKEGLFSIKKPMTAKERALKNNAPKMVDGNQKPEPSKTARQVNKAGQSDRQDWKFEDKDV